MLNRNDDGFNQRTLRADRTPSTIVGSIVAAGRTAAQLLAIVLPCLLSMDTAQAQGNPQNLRSDLREELYCLALNIYFESRDQPELGQLAVGHVVLNRVQDRRFPDTICGVVQDGGKRGKLHGCQFSWWCDGQSDEPGDARAWQASMVMANYVYWGFSKDPTYGALWYHADYVRPVWRKALQRGPEIGSHIFYLQANSKDLAADQRASRSTPAKGGTVTAALEPQG